MYKSLNFCVLLGFLWSTAAGPTGWAQTAFTYTGSVQTYTVPACGVYLNVDVIGASGADYVASTGGKGGRVQAKIPVNAGESLNIYVGGAASNNTGGWNGGASGTISAGGGASDIRRGLNLNGRLIVAGGGGGAGYPAGCPSNSHGGNGGGLIAQNGWWCNDASNSVSYTGKGGTQTSGGAGSSSGSGASGSFGNGGAGGAQGGAGGGGWYGGGGSNSTGGGGGGSSYTVPGAQNVVHAQGHQIGSGRITIISAETGTPSPLNLAGRNKVCAEDTALYRATEVPNATSYTWTLPAGASILEGEGSHQVLVKFGDSGGDVTVSAQSSCGPGIPKSIKVDVVGLPRAGFIAPDTSYVDSVIMFMDTSALATNWSWDFGDSTTLALQHPMHWYKAPGTFTVTLIAGNELCYDTASREILILEESTGIPGIVRHEGIVTYPNPAQHSLWISLPQSVPFPCMVELMDVQGRTRMRTSISETLTQLDVSNVQPGLYRMHIKWGQESIRKSVLVLRH